MLKALEARELGSCWNKADDGELVFVLLGRDAAAPAAIIAWCKERVRLGKNHPNDPQVVSAQVCAAEMTHRQLHGTERDPQPEDCAPVAPDVSPDALEWL